MLEATKPPVKARRKRHVGSPLPLELKLADGTIGQVWDYRVIVYKVGMRRHRLALHRFHGAWRIFNRPVYDRRSQAIAISQLDALVGRVGEERFNAAIAARSPKVRQCVS